MPRPRKRRWIHHASDIHISPFPRGLVTGTVVMTHDEMEAVILVDYQCLTQEEAGKRMGVSRGTVWRLLQSGRKKLASVLAERKELIVVSHENLGPFSQDID